MKTKLLIAGCFISTFSFLASAQGVGDKEGTYAPGTVAQQVTASGAATARPQGQFKAGKMPKGFLSPSVMVDDVMKQTFKSFLPSKFFKLDSSTALSDGVLELKDGSKMHCTFLMGTEVYKADDGVDHVRADPIMMGCESSSQVIGKKSPLSTALPK